MLSALFFRKPYFYKCYNIRYEEMYRNGFDDVVTPGENHKIFAIEVNGTKIDILIFNYCDKILLIITQFGKIGSFFKVRRTVPEEGEAREDVYEVQTLFGDDPIEYQVAARTLAESMLVTKPILFGFALRNVTLPTLQAIRSAVLENKIW